MNRSILVYRFSAFGDVLLTIPILISALENNPELDICIITRDRFTKFFPVHNRLHIKGINLDNYKGISGIFRLYQQIRKEGPYSHIIDLHQVIRTKLLSFFFFLSGNKVIRINKHRRARRQFINGNREIVLPSVRMLYQTCFEKAGLQMSNLTRPIYPQLPITKKLEENRKRIGISPFSQHATKNWSLANFKIVVEKLDSSIKADFYFYCSKDEVDLLFDFQGDNMIKTATLFDTAKEIQSIQNLDLMLSLDSANMHLADLAGVPVLSIWGGTHPDMGYGLSGTNHQLNILSPLELDCQPCSVFGKSRCKLKDTPFLCLTSIPPEEVANLALETL